MATTCSAVCVPPAAAAARTASAWSSSHSTPRTAVACGVGHTSPLERATGLRCWPYQSIRATVTLAALAAFWFEVADAA